MAKAKKGKVFYETNLKTHRRLEALSTIFNSIH